MFFGNFHLENGAFEVAEQWTRESDFEHLEEKTIIRVCTELTLHHVWRLTGLPVKLQGIDNSDGILKQGYRRFGQNIVGDRKICVTVDFGDPLVAIAAKGMIGLDVDPGGEAALDAGCELINLIGGNACTRLEKEGYRLRPEPPFFSGTIKPDPVSRSSARGTALAGDRSFEFNIFIDPL